MDESAAHKGRFTYDTDSEYGNGALRFVAYRLPGAEDRSEEFIRGAGFEKAEEAVKKQKSGKYFCEDDARNAFLKLTASFGGVYSADAEYRIDPRLEKIDPDGPHWRVYPGEVSIVEDMVGKAAKRYSLEVLVTNLPRRPNGGADLREGATQDEVVDLYLGQYLSEKGFRLMKNGMGVGHVYIHTHSRQDVMSFIVSLATMLQDLIDAVLKREIESKRPVTMEQLKAQFFGGILRYDRAKDTVSFAGASGMKDEFYGYMDALGLKKEFLLGF